jgi:hypothetical protein
MAVPFSRPWQTVRESMTAAHTWVDMFSFRRSARRGCGDGRDYKIQGLGRPRKMGVSGSTVVRRRAPCEGGVVTTSGSKRLFSARSIAAVQALRVPVLNIGAEIIRRAAWPQAGQPTDAGAVASGRITSNTPSCSHRYS